MRAEIKDRVGIKHIYLTADSDEEIEALAELMGGNEDGLKTIAFPVMYGAITIL